ncbi:MAG: hypothetical protein JSC161_000788 [Candidatus Tokpelaia sp. JSC161]|jgi:hypothetical protein|nr:MAG: hypothetical protein JSC161_000788 [Candidatus Tokpelaia sp. JSC161]
MIRFLLHCDQAHTFDAWFHSNDDYEMQCTKNLINCPLCSSTAVEKMLMTPTVSTSRRRDKREEGQVVLNQLRQLSKQVRENADYVGNQFAEEARKIHFCEIDPRAIYGEATAQEVTALLQDGIEILPLLPLPEEQN